MKKKVEGGYTWEVWVIVPTEQKKINGKVVLFKEYSYSLGTVKAYSYPKAMQKARKQWRNVPNKIYVKRVS